MQAAGRSSSLHPFSEQTHNSWRPPDKSCRDVPCRAAPGSAQIIMCDIPEMVASGVDVFTLSGPCSTTGEPGMTSSGLAPT